MERADRTALRVKSILIACVCKDCQSEGAGCAHCDLDKEVQPYYQEMMQIIVGSS